MTHSFPDCNIFSPSTMIIVQTQIWISRILYFFNKKEFSWKKSEWSQMKIGRYVSPPSINVNFDVLLWCLTGYNLCLNVSLICFFIRFESVFNLYFDGFTRILMIFTSNLEFLSKCHDGQQDFETCQLSYAENTLRVHPVYYTVNPGFHWLQRTLILLA